MYVCVCNIYKHSLLSLFLCIYGIRAGLWALDHQ